MISTHRAQSTIIDRLSGVRSRLRTSCAPALPEALVACIIAQSLADGRKLGGEDRLRLVTASSRLLAAVDAAGLDPDGARIYRSLVKSRAAVIDLAAERAATNAKRVGGKLEASSEAEHA